MNEKQLNAARKRFDSLLLAQMRDEGTHGLAVYRKDGMMWVTNGRMAMLYYEVDFYLNPGKFEDNPRLGEFIEKIAGYGMTNTAEISLKRPINGEEFCIEFSDGINDLWASESLWKVFGKKFDYCIIQNTLAVFNDGQFCGFILPLRKEKANA
jgi:hypothetical protein